ncbi:DBF4-type domain-containing protein [Caerostris darwini]|uniref:DBF4-type domain-containing protein n=1 Tax=Caerostris darwini TaxID=1538125 RepID=A0AAV4QMQ4_9ARAC|nr:DBF4-type domain-containing protein [Caerostris darwini]
MNMCPSFKHKVPPQLCLKGQVFFILSSPQLHQLAAEKIPLLGGRVEQFLNSNLTTVLIDDLHLASSQHLPDEIIYRLSCPAVPGVSYSHPSVLCNLPSTSRGYNLVTSTTTSLYRVILFARSCGIQVLGITYFLSSIEPIIKSLSHSNPPAPKKNQTLLSGCFIKVECCQKKFRPCYKMFSIDPERLMPLRNAHILVKPETCNGILDKPTGPRQVHYNHMDPNNRTLNHAQDSKPPVKEKKFQKLKPKEENNYCECCRTHFNDLKTHIKSSNHQKFVANEKNYESVNNILKMLPSPQEFIQKHQKHEQATNLVLHNNEMMLKDINSAGFCMPLNLHVKKVHSPVPLKLNDEYEKMPSPLNLHVKKEDIPMALHHNQNVDIKQEPQMAHAEPSPTNVSNDSLNSVQKSEIDVVEIKTNSPHVDDIVDCKDLCIPEMANEVLEVSVEDTLLDKTNTAALAQLCLKNFENCWMETMDNLPEMDDIIFDDNIFDLDAEDSKPKDDENDCPEQEGSFSPSDIINSPGFVSGISTDMKTQPNINTSILINSPIDIKDVVVKTEPYSPACHTDTKYNETLSPSNLAIHQSLINDKISFNENFDIKPNSNPFYIDKPNGNANPSCSNAVSVKLSEQMFSSDSSDDENENVLISNVLNIITTNSDSEMKADKDNYEERVVSGHKSIGQLDKKNVSNNSIHSTINMEVNNLESNSQSCIGNIEICHKLKPGVSFTSKPESPQASSSIMNINQNDICVPCSSISTVPCVNYSELANQNPIQLANINNTFITGVSNTETMEVKKAVISNSNISLSQFCNSSPPDSRNLSISKVNIIERSDNPSPLNMTYAGSPSMTNPCNSKIDIENSEISNICKIPLSVFSNNSVTNKRDISISKISVVNRSDDPNPVDMTCAGNPAIANVFNTKNIDAQKCEISNVHNIPLSNISKNSASCTANASHEKGFVERSDNSSPIDVTNLSDPIVDNVNDAQIIDLTSCGIKSLFDGRSSIDMNCIEKTVLNNKEMTGGLSVISSHKQLYHESCYPLQAEVCKFVPDYATKIPQDGTTSFDKSTVKNPMQLCTSNFNPNCKTEIPEISEKREWNSMMKREQVSVNSNDPICVRNKKLAHNFREEKASPTEKTAISTNDKICMPKEQLMDSQATCTKAQLITAVPKNKKIPHKKSTRKSKHLPSLWSVCILPGKGLKLKFTCIHPKSSESEEEEAKLIENLEYN